MTTVEFPFSHSQLWTCARDTSCCPSLTWNQKIQGSGAQRGEDIPGQGMQERDLELALWDGADTDEGS